MYRWIVSLVTGVHDVDRPKDEWKTPRKKKRTVAGRPRLTPLENRCLLSCGPSGNDDEQPWCRDGQFSGDGQAEINIANHLEEARAAALQTVPIGGGLFEQRPVLAGFATPTGGVPNYALARFCANGHLDDGTGSGSGGCGGSGFGDSGTGILMIDFYPSYSDDTGKINAIAVYDVEATEEYCDGETQRITVVGTVRVPAEDIDGPELDVWGVARFCPDGTIDEGFGENPQDYEADEPFPVLDEPGMVTIVFSDGSDDWSREQEGLALVVEPLLDGEDSPRLVIGGKVPFPPPPNPEGRLFRSGAVRYR